MARVSRRLAPNKTVGVTLPRLQRRQPWGKLSCTSRGSRFPGAPSEKTSVQRVSQQRPKRTGQKMGEKSREKTGMKKPVGLDKPCQLCEQTIYYGYDGPVEGICGRCVDLIRGKRGGNSGKSRVVIRNKTAKASGSFLFLAFAVGVIAGILVQPFLSQL